MRLASNPTRIALHAVSLDEQLQGECVYPLSTPLTDWYLLYGNWLYRGDRRLEPGDTIALADFPATRYLDWHLTRRRVSAEHKDISTPWDQADQDVLRIVEMVMFHDAAGGAQLYASPAPLPGVSRPERPPADRTRRFWSGGPNGPPRICSATVSRWMIIWNLVGHFIALFFP